VLTATVEATAAGETAGLTARFPSQLTAASISSATLRFIDNLSSR
jgi:hypothetical protein